MRRVGVGGWGGDDPWKCEADSGHNGRLCACMSFRLSCAALGDAQRQTCAHEWTVACVGDARVLVRGAAAGTHACAPACMHTGGHASPHGWCAAACGRKPLPAHRVSMVPGLPSKSQAAVPDIDNGLQGG